MREEKLAQAEREKVQLDGTKARAKAIAKLLRAPRVENGSSAIMNVPPDTFAPVPHITNPTESHSHGSPVMYTSSTALDHFAAHEGMQSEFAIFGGSYKKAPIVFVCV